MLSGVGFLKVQWGSSSRLPTESGVPAFSINIAGSNCSPSKVTVEFEPIRYPTVCHSVFISAFSLLGILPDSHGLQTHMVFWQSRAELWWFGFQPHQSTDGHYKAEYPTQFLRPCIFGKVQSLKRISLGMGWRPSNYGSSSILSCRTQWRLLNGSPLDGRDEAICHCRQPISPIFLSSGWQWRREEFWF